MKEVQASMGDAPEHPKCPECRKKMRRSYKDLNIGGNVEGGTNGGTRLGR